MRIIAVVNQKGGVGKTTTSVNLGAALAMRGRRVLLVDLDPQGNLSDHLLGDPAEGRERASVYDVLVEGKPILEAIVPTRTPGLHVLPSDEDLAGAELDLASVIGREVLLRDALADVPDDAFDYVLLDCPPSLGLLSLNALAAAHEVFIALQTEFFAMRGLGALDRTVDLVKRRINPTLRVTGIVPTLVDATRLSREVVDEVRGHYGDLLFSSRIRSNIRLAEAPSHGKHIFDYAPESPGAADYAALAREVEEGRDAVEPAGEAAVGAHGGEGAPRTEGVPATAGSGEATFAPQPGARPRGIARAIQEATASVVAGAGLPRPPPRPAPGARGGMVGTGAPATGETARAQGETPAPAPHDVSAAPTAAAVPAAASPTVSAPPPAPPPSTPSIAAPVRGLSSAPTPTPPPGAMPSAPVRRPSVPLPVLRSGPRPLSTPPMPTRPPSSLPRPAPLPQPPRPV